MKLRYIILILIICLISTINAKINEMNSQKWIPYDILRESTIAVTGKVEVEPPPSELGMRILKVNGAKLFHGNAQIENTIYIVSSPVTLGYNTGPLLNAGSYLLFLRPICHEIWEQVAEKPASAHANGCAIYEVVSTWKGAISMDHQQSDFSNFAISRQYQLMTPEDIEASILQMYAITDMHNNVATIEPAPAGANVLIKRFTEEYSRNPFKVP